MEGTASKVDNSVATEAPQSEGSADGPVDEDEISTPVKGPPTKRKRQLGVTTRKSSKK